MNLCCMDCVFKFCFFMSFPCVGLAQFDFKVRLRKVHTTSLARDLIGWGNVKVFANCRSEWTQYYIGVESFNWYAFHCHRFILIPMPSFITYCSGFAYDSRYRHLLRTVAFTRFSVCSFLRLLYTANRSVTGIFEKPIFLRSSKPV